MKKPKNLHPFHAIFWTVLFVEILSTAFSYTYIGRQKECALIGIIIFFLVCKMDTLTRIVHFISTPFEVNAGTIN